MWQVRSETIHKLEILGDEADMAALKEVLSKGTFKNGNERYAFLGAIIQELDGAVRRNGKGDN
jgi:hypothetical protein